MRSYCDTVSCKDVSVCEHDLLNQDAQGSRSSRVLLLSFFKCKSPAIVHLSKLCIMCALGFGSIHHRPYCALSIERIVHWNLDGDAHGG